MKTLQKKPIIRLKVLKEDVGYTVLGQWRDRHLITCGDTWEELKAMIVDMVNLSFADMGIQYSIEEIKLTYDLPSFFNFYRILNAKAFSERIGMQQSLLAQYIGGHKKPSPAQARRILNGVQQLGQELATVDFLL